MIKNQQEFKGLDVRTSDLLKDPNYCTVMDNIELSQNGYLTPCTGYSSIGSTNQTGFIQLITHFNADGVEELLGVKTDGLYLLDKSTMIWSKVVCPNNNTAIIDFTVPLSYVSFEGILYLTDPARLMNPLKYVPKTTINNAVAPYIYLMGATPAKVVYSSGAGSSFTSGSYYLLFVYRFEDTITYYGNYHIVEGVASITNYRAEDHVYIAGRDPRFEYMPHDRADIDVVKMELLCYASTSPLYGFRFCKKFDYGYMSHVTASNSFTKNITVSASEITDAISDGAFLADIYDISSTKRMPPTVAKFIANHNGVMVMGDYQDDNLIDTGVTVLPITKKPNGFIWSDTTTGGTVENFPALNSDKVGVDSYGLTGLFSDPDNLVIHKNNKVYYISGALYNSGYRIRDSLADGLGATSHLSLLSVEGNGIFMSSKGLYITSNGSKPVEMTDKIEPLITDSDLDKSKAISVMDPLKEKVYFCIPSLTGNHKIFQYDFYWKIWSTRSGIDFSKGITLHNYKIYFTEGTDVFVFDEGYSYDGSSYVANYSSVWLLEGDASLRKKFTYLDLVCFNSEAVNISLTTNKDWKDTVEVSATKSLANATNVDFPLAMNNCKSLKFNLSATILNNSFKIAGINYEVSGAQSRFKGED